MALILDRGVRSMAVRPEQSHIKDGPTLATAMSGLRSTSVSELHPRRNDAGMAVILDRGVRSMLARLEQ